MQRALGHATILNAVRKHGDFMLTTVPANALQPYHQNDNAWDQGQIFFTPNLVWGMPTFYAQQMAAANHLPLRVQDSTEGKLNVTATLSENGKVLVLHVVNTDRVLQQTSLVIKDFTAPKQLVQVFTLSGGLNAENTPGKPDAIATRKSVVKLSELVNNGYRFEPFSYTILRLEK